MRWEVVEGLGGRKYCRDEMGGMVIRVDEISEIGLEMMANKLEQGFLRR